MEKQYKPKMAAWIRKTKSGEEYLAIKTEDGKWTNLFKNKYKNGEKSPDYKEAKSKPNVAGSEPIFNSDENIPF